MYEFQNKRDMRIYLVTDEGLLLGKDLYRTVEAAVKGGVSMVQIREKESSTREFIERAIRLKEVLTPYGVPLIINDRVDVALAAMLMGYTWDKAICLTRWLSGYCRRGK